ncbi:MAG: hypothetical protein HYU66_22820 [Armatimonadetes bacterium]|nr:hypothetical protein [Armatimonadota bacterium]
MKALGIPAALLLLTASARAEERRFEVAAWVDHFDFAGAAAGGKLLFDTETPEGNARILGHVQELGATTILWRNCAGSTMRYPSRLETGHQDAPRDKRRVPSSATAYGWVRYAEARPDILRTALDLCRQHGLRPGVHWPFEENHWAGFTFGGWNLEHPQFWCRNVEGVPWAGRSSLGFPEVVEHKLGLFGELLDRGADVVFLDFFRNGGWSPAYEYTEPVKAAWRERHGTEPPASPLDPQWCAHVGDYVTELLRAMKARARAAGRPVELWAGIPQIAPLGDAPLRHHGADWQRWVREGLVDGIVINNVQFDRADPYGSTRALYADVLKLTRGHCKLYCPVAAYDYTGFGVPDYRKVTGESFTAVARRLMELAWEVGADGISLECVDYDNYPADARQMMRELAAGKCHNVKP